MGKFKTSMLDFVGKPLTVGCKVKSITDESDGEVLRLGNQKVLVKHVWGFTWKWPKKLVIK